MQETEAFIAVKGRKEGLSNKLLFRLLIHQNLILVKQTNQLSQRQVLSNEIAPLTLLNGLRVFPKKSVLSLVDFDVKNFYPSISMKLDTDSIKYAKTLIELTNQDLAIIM